MKLSAGLALSSSKGFTLVELLVVMAIIALVSVFTFSNYKSFGQDQSLKNAALDIQTQLRAAQTNATTNLQCGSEYSAIWQVEFTSDATTVNLKCSLSPDIQKTLKLDTDIKVLEVSGTSCPSTLPFTVSFKPLSGNMEIYDSTPTLMSSCSLLTVTLQHTQTTNTKLLNIEKGGKVYVQ